MKEIFNVLGDTQREQWHTIVNLLRQLGGSMTYEGRDEICKELDRYIDRAEDIFDRYRNKKSDKEDSNID